MTLSDQGQSKIERNVPEYASSEFCRLLGRFSFLKKIELEYCLCIVKYVQSSKKTI